jgi:hypothetical protein
MLMNNWLSELTNYEEDEVEISFFSLDEEALTIQSSYFFLSKIGTRVRKIVFPKDISEIKNDYDVVISGNKRVIDYFKDNDEVYTILIPNETTSGCVATDEYDSLDNVIKDEKLLEKLQEFVNNKNNKNNVNG